MLEIIRMVTDFAIEFFQLQKKKKKKIATDFVTDQCNMRPIFREKISCKIGRKFRIYDRFCDQF